MRRSVLIKWLVAAGIVGTVLTHFVPIISRGALTRYAHHKAEELLQTKIKMASAELQLLSGSLVIRNLKVFNPLRKEEIFMRAKKISLRFQYFPMIFGHKGELSLGIDKPELIYTTDRRGRWELSKKIPLFRRGKGEKRLPFNVESITLKNGTVEYRDGKVKKTTKVSDIDLKVTRVRLPLPDDPLPAKFKLKFVIDKRAKFSMSGRADFLSPKTSFEADIKLRGLPLPPFAPYYQSRSLPVHIVRGTMAMSSKAKCHRDQLRAPAHASISGLEVKAKRKRLFGFAASNVVDSLKNRKGNLELDMMISGNIRNPQFHLTSDLSRAFVKGFSKGLVEGVPDTLEGVGKGVKEGVGSGLDKFKGLFR